MAYRHLVFAATATAAVIYAAVTTPAHAQAQPGGRDPRPDSICAILESRTEALIAGPSPAVPRPAAGHRFLTFATTALQVTAPMLGGHGDGSVVLQQAASALQLQALQAQASAGDPMVAPRAPAAERLKALPADQGC